LPPGQRKSSWCKNKEMCHTNGLKKVVVFQKGRKKRGAFSAA